MWPLGAQAKAVNSGDLDRSGLKLLRRIRDDNDAPQTASFYFYFPRVDGADQVAGELRHAGFAVTVTRGSRAPDWLVLACTSILRDSEIEDLRGRFETLAREHGGEYDGWEVAIVDD